MIGEKELYCSIDNECKKNYFVGSSLKFETNPELFSEHLEGDRRVVLHAKHTITKGPCNIII